MPPFFEKRSVNKKMKKKLEQSGEDENKMKRKAWYKWAAAAAVLVVGSGSTAIYQMNKQTGEMNTEDQLESTDNETEQLVNTNEIEQTETASKDTEDVQDDAETENSSDYEKVVKIDAGELYTVAEDYGQVYDMLQKNEESSSTGIVDYGVTEDMITSDVLSPEINIMADKRAENTQTDVEDSVKGNGFSKTNVMTEGVDESDIVKTDGNYIYRVTKEGVKITDVTGESMKMAGNITVKGQSGAWWIREMYVEGDVLNLIIESEETDLKESDGTEADDAIQDVYYMDTAETTQIFTYDISDKSKPKLTGAYVQDGYYNTSRKVGDIIYLFTEQRMMRPLMDKAQAVTPQILEDWIPAAGGKTIPADCIYLPKQGGNSLVVSSIDVKKPEKTVDTMMIVNDFVNIYVSDSTIYLYGSCYETEEISTRFAGFSFENGIMNAIGAGSVKGEIRDTFAINETDKSLRILTTEWKDEENQNNLYLFDGELKQVGSLTGLAKGEQIYAARFLGDMAYFVTYRNTDPLFAVDLSDEANPEVVSELKITGFSEYLHFWGEDKLLGIGYETDPDTGMQKGLKLTMFDISDPANLKAINSIVIENADYSPALDNYKTVLADASENLIGFATQNYDNQKAQYGYLLFSWENGAFRNLLSESLGDENYPDEYRGLYIGDVFYLACENQLKSFDRDDAYQLLQQIE